MNIITYPVYTANIWYIVTYVWSLGK